MIKILNYVFCITLLTMASHSTYAMENQTDAMAAVGFRGTRALVENVGNIWSTEQQLENILANRIREAQFLHQEQFDIENQISHGIDSHKKRKLSESSAQGVEHLTQRMATINGRLLDISIDINRILELRYEWKPLQNQESDSDSDNE